MKNNCKNEEFLLFCVTPAISELKCILLSTFILTLTTYLLVLAFLLACFIFARNFDYVYWAIFYHLFFTIFIISNYPYVNKIKRIYAPDMKPWEHLKHKQHYVTTTSVENFFAKDVQCDKDWFPRTFTMIPTLIAFQVYQFDCC